MSAIMEELYKEAEEKRLLQDIRSLMDTMKLTAEQAMDAFKVPVDDREKFAAELSEKL